MAESKRYQITFPADLMRQVDAVANKLGMNRSEFLRHAARLNLMDLGRKSHVVRECLDQLAQDMEAER